MHWRAWTTRMAYGRCWAFSPSSTPRAPTPRTQSRSAPSTESTLRCRRRLCRGAAAVANRGFAAATARRQTADRAVCPSNSETLGPAPATTRCEDGRNNWTRGGVCVRGAARPNCHTLVLSLETPGHLPCHSPRAPTLLLYTPGICSPGICVLHALHVGTLTGACPPDVLVSVMMFV